MKNSRFWWRKTEVQKILWKSLFIQDFFLRKNWKAINCSRTFTSRWSQNKLSKRPTMVQFIVFYNFYPRPWEKVLYNLITIINIALLAQNCCNSKKLEIGFLPFLNITFIYRCMHSVIYQKSTNKTVTSKNI